MVILTRPDLSGFSETSAFRGSCSVDGKDSSKQFNADSGLAAHRPEDKDQVVRFAEYLRFRSRPEESLNESRERLVALIEEGRVASQAEAARLLGVSPVQVNRVVLSAGLDLKYTRPARPVLVCKTCSRRYQPTPKTHSGVCARCQRGATASTLVCPRCGLSRTLGPGAIRMRKTALCKPCQSKLPRDLYELEVRRFVAAESTTAT